ncbi:hypothetical protein RIF29_33606 [Crotalaria pallida]|uniref:Uncharacterized protein n=1 Tax=Crotalaria pallida TaxID=3830 RepID=A0AAN9E801_CROPI
MEGPPTTAVRFGENPPQEHLWKEEEAAVGCFGSHLTENHTDSFGPGVDGASGPDSRFKDWWRRWSLAAARRRSLASVRSEGGSRDSRLDWEGNARSVHGGGGG